MVSDLVVLDLVVLDLGGRENGTAPRAVYCKITIVRYCAWKEMGGF